MFFSKLIRSIFTRCSKPTENDSDSQSESIPYGFPTKYKYNLLCPKGVAIVYNGLLYLYVEDDIFLNPEINFVFGKYEFPVSSYEEIVEMNKKRLSKDVDYLHRDFQAKSIADIDLVFGKRQENNFYISTDNLELITYIKMMYYV